MPGVSTLVIATLAVVIAAITTIFSVTDSLLLRPVAGREPDRLVRVYANRSSNPWYRDYEYFRDRSTTVDLAAFDDQRVSIRIDDQTQPAFAELLTANYFDVVGVRAALGRLIAPADGLPGAAPVVVLSDRFWRQRVSADRGVVGRTIVVNGVDFTIAGVAPPSFSGAYGIYGADVWVPITLDPVLRPGTALVRGENSRGVQIIGRLRSGATMAAAGADLAALAAEQAKAFPLTSGNRTATVYAARTFPPEFEAALALFLGILLAIAAVLLLAACANVANVLLARAAGKSRDIALRQAIGATRWRLVRQQLAEGLVLSAAAAAAALTLTWWVTRLLTIVRLPTTVPLIFDFRMDVRVLLFGALMAALTTVVCSLAPALQGTRAALLTALRTAEATMAARSRLRSAFVVAQVASSVLLLVIAGLFVRSLARVNTIDLGMNPRNVLLVALDTETRGYSTERSLRFYRELLERVESTPGVVAASLADIVPLSLNDRAMGLPAPDQAPQSVRVSFNQVSRGVFATLGIRLLEGRDFTDGDTAGGRRVVILNEALARRWFGSRSVLGQRFPGPTPPGAPAVYYEVVGIAANASYQRIGEPQSFFAYFPIAQMFSPAPTLMVRSSGDPIALAPAIRTAIRSLDEGLPIFSVETLEASSLVTLLPARIAAGVSGALGGLVLLLSTIGLYGVVAFMVRQRRREIGIRISLGATSSSVAGMFLQQSLRWAAIGLAIGVSLAFAATRLIGGLLFGISPLDAPTFGGAVALMLAVTCAASYAPALRAASSNPVDALRAD
jgi:predicted permease